MIALTQVLGALALVGVGIALSAWRRAQLEQEIGVAVVRAFIQLTAVGYVLNYVFDSGNPAWTSAILVVMVVVGGVTASRRAGSVPGALSILLVSLGLAIGATLGTALLTGALAADARTLIPVGGMTIGNAMTAAAVALNRLGDDVSAHAPVIEARLALGASSGAAVAPVARQSIASGMIHVIDSTKTAGLVFFPGTMVGMILAGAEPLNAVRLQLVLFFLLIGGVAIAVFTSVSLASRRFFTADHQLREPIVSR